MNTKQSNFHRGLILHSVAKRSIKTITKIANDAGYEKSSFYVHIKQEDLPLDILYKYGKAIPHDFDIEIPEMADYLELHGLKKDQEVKLSYDELLKEKERWKDKFYALLEEHNNVLRNNK